MMFGDFRHLLFVFVVLWSSGKGDCWIRTYTEAFDSVMSSNPKIRQRLRDDCLCDLHGEIEDCSCSVDIVDRFNNVKLYPRLKTLLSKDYFRFFKVNLRGVCPFWADDGTCSMATCGVKTCGREDVPYGLRGDEAVVQRIRDCGTETDVDQELSHLNKSTSPQIVEDFKLWQAYDEENFTHLPDERAEYVDLAINPERYTGYKGKSARRIWEAIYFDNCFWPSESCLEKRIFNRVISGLHASINVHLSANYLFSKSTSKFPGEEFWGPNAAEFNRRFGGSHTNGSGPKWLKNLYFLYLVELRAVDKVSPHLWNQTFYTGNSSEDADTQSAVRDILKIASSFRNHFDETTLFEEGGARDDQLKTEFRHRFRNVSRIMDCVGCEKCKLWGKLQVQGLGTALKILFTSRFDSISTEIPNVTDHTRKPRAPELARSEIVTLFNAIGRLSYSIHAIEQLKQMI